jgi:hypothetical protein
VFELAGHSAVVKNCRGYSGKSDDSVSGVVFVLDVENVLAANIAALLGRDDTPANIAQIVQSYFEPITETDTRQDKLYPGLVEERVSYHAENKPEITFTGFRPKNQQSDPERTAWIGSISFTPRMGARFDVRCLIRIEDPQAGLMDYLRRNIYSAVRVELKCDTGFRFEIKQTSQAPVSMELPLPEPTDRDQKEIDDVVDTMEREGTPPPKKKAAERAPKRKTARAKKAA